MQLFSAKELNDFTGDVAVLLDSGEFEGVGAVGEEGYHHRGVALGGEDAVGVAGLGVGAVEDGGAGLVVGADDHEGVAVLLGEADGGFDGFVEVEGFADGLREFVGVLVLVDAGAFDHQEEAFLAAGGEVVDGHLSGLGQVGAALAAVHGRGQVEQALGIPYGRVPGVVDHGEAAADGFLGGDGHAHEDGLGAGGGEVELAVGQVGPNAFLGVAGVLVGKEGRRGGAVEVVGGQDAAGIALRGEDLGDVGDGLAGGILAQESVVGLLAGGIGGAGGGGVRGEVVGGLGADEADGVEVGHREFAAVGVHRGVDGALAHAVADHQDDVVHPGFLAVVGEGRGVGALFLGIGLGGRCFDFTVSRLGGEAEGGAEGNKQESEMSSHCFAVNNYLLVDPNFVDEDESLASGAGVPVGDGADVLGAHPDVAGAGGDGDFAVPDADLVVPAVHRVVHAGERGEADPVGGGLEFDAARHPDPGAGVLAEAGADPGDFPLGEQVHHGFEVGALVALPAARAPVEAAPAAVDQALVAAGGVLAAVAGVDGDGAVGVDFVDGAAGGEAAASAVPGEGFHRAGFPQGEGAVVAPEGLLADAVPDLAFAADGHAGAVGEDVAVEFEGGVDDDGLGDAGDRSFALLRMT